MKHLFNFFILWLLTCNTSFGATSKCKDIYFDDTLPEILYAKLKPKTKELCYDEFAVLYSGQTKTPLWSAEHLTKEMVSKKVSRTTNYHVEEKLKESERAEIMDYIASHYDKGLLASSGDFLKNDSYKDSFTLANVIPQNHTCKVGIWARVEEAIREVARQKEQIYVVSGTLYMEKHLQQIRSGIVVPTKLYKAVFVPSTGEGGAYVVSNSSDKSYEIIGIAELEKISGINLFPKMTGMQKMNVMKLPDPNNLQNSKSEWKAISKEIGIEQKSRP